MSVLKFVLFLLPAAVVAGAYLYMKAKGFDVTPASEQPDPEDDQQG